MPRFFDSESYRRICLFLVLAFISLGLQACVIPLTNAALKSMSGDEPAEETASEPAQETTSSGSTAEASPQRECKLNSDGTQTCGYHCMMGSNGTFNCASTPEGSCSMSAGGDISCSDPGQASAGSTQTNGASDSGGSSSGGAETSARCCINGAYYSCPSAVDAKICIGEPMQLMSCLDNCGMDSSCEDGCLREHGPEPQESECTREPSRDNECEQD
ncbi:MAG: hypothetical protein ACLFVJ_17780 [Persicimonas sp.]